MASSDREVELERKMKAQKEQLSTQARQAVFEAFPEKILHLGQLIQSFTDPSHPLHHSNINPDLTIFTIPSSVPTEPSTRSPPGEKPLANGSAGAGGKEGAANGVVEADDEDEKSLRTGLKTNEAYKLMGEMLREEGERTLDICMTLRMWLFTVTPAVEEGNNTGVEIQEMALSAVNSLHNLGSDCCNYLSTARQNRAAMARQYLRAPGIEDRKLAIEEGDKVEVFGARSLIMLLQSKYLEVQGIFQRNWNKICEPKGHRDHWNM